MLCSYGIIVDNNTHLQELEDKLDEFDILIRSFLDKQGKHETEIEELQSVNNDLDTKLEELKELTSKNNGQSSGRGESDDNVGKRETASKVTESNSTVERTLSENFNPGGSRNRSSGDTHVRDKGADTATGGQRKIAEGYEKHLKTSTQGHRLLYICQQYRTRSV